MTCFESEPELNKNRKFKNKIAEPKPELSPKKLNLPNLKLNRNFTF